MTSKAEIAEINDILSPPVKEVVEDKPEVEDETTDETTEIPADEELAAQSSEEEVEVTDDEVVAETDDGAGDADKTYTPAELADAVGWELDDVYNGVVIPMKDGENIPLGEIKNKYQDLTHEVTNLQTQLSEATKGLEQAQSGVAQGQQLSNAMIEQVGYLNQINAAEQGTDWEELESLDPTEAILKRDKIRRARDEVQGKIGALQQQEQVQQQAFMQSQRDKMMELMPEWKDAAVKEKDEAGMLTVMREYGFEDDETRSIIDPRQMKLLKRLSYLESKDKLAAGAIKRVRKAPIALKGRKVEPASNQDKVDGLVTKAKQSGDKRDAHKAISALLAQG